MLYSKYTSFITTAYTNWSNKKPRNFFIYFFCKHYYCFYCQQFDLKQPSESDNDFSTCFRSPVSHPISCGLCSPVFLCRLLIDKGVPKSKLICLLFHLLEFLTVRPSVNAPFPNFPYLHTKEHTLKAVFTEPHFSEEMVRNKVTIERFGERRGSWAGLAFGPAFDKGAD